MSTAAAIVGITSAVSTGTTAYGLYEKNKAENAAREYDAKTEERNAYYASEQAAYLMEQANYLEGEAQDTLRQGILEENSFRRNLNAFIGGQKSSYGASNVVTSSGSASKVMQDSAKEGELDAMTIKYNYEKKVEAIKREQIQNIRSAKRYKDLASDYLGNAANLRAGKTSSLLPVAGALLDGTSSLAKYYATAPSSKSSSRSKQYAFG